MTISVSTGQTAGKILVDGIDVLENPNEVRKRIAYMTQEPDLSPALLVWEYITYYFRFRDLAKRSKTTL